MGIISRVGVKELCSADLLTKRVCVLDDEDLANSIASGDAAGKRIGCLIRAPPEHQSTVSQLNLIESSLVPHMTNQAISEACSLENVVLSLVKSCTKDLEDYVLFACALILRSFMFRTISML